MILLGRGDELRFIELPGRTSADPFVGSADRRDVSVRLVRLTHTPDRRPHRHPHSTETVHVLAGEGEAWVDGVRTPVRAGDTFLVPKGVPHATIPSPERALELLCFFPHPDLTANIEEIDGPPLG